MIGENNFWQNWNNQILGLVGSSHAGEFNGTATVIFDHALTSGVTSISLGTAGLATASDGIALFDQNWATLWGSSQNVLTILDVNPFYDDRWFSSNRVFAENIATWLSSPTAASTTVPDEGSTMTLFGLVLIALGVLRRHKASS